MSVTWCLQFHPFTALIYRTTTSSSAVTAYSRSRTKVTPGFSKRKQKTPIRTIEDIQITTPIITEEEKIKYNNLAQLNNNFRPIFIDVYGESFLWNMVRKMMRIFVLVGQKKLSLNNVEELLNPNEDDEKACIKVMDADQLILMDIEYEGINFEKDDYAMERFKRILIKNLFNYQRNYSLTKCLINSLDDI